MYGAIIAIGILISALLAEKLTIKDKKSASVIWNALFISLIAGVVGARLYHVLDYWDIYSKNITLIFLTTTGGLGVLGGLIAGLSTFYIYLKLTKNDLKYYFNLAGTVIPLAQAIGRWANFFNNELYGVRGHPIFLYESLLNLILFGFLYKNYTKGKNFYYYLLGYGLIRYFLEFFRQNPWTFYNLNVAQMISILFIITAYVNLYRLRSRGL